MLANRSMPRSPVVPVLAYPDVAEAVQWLCETFGFRERWRVGRHRAPLGIGDAAVAVTQATSGSSRGGDSVMVRVVDVDVHHERALARGAHVLNAPTDYPYGERQYSVEDLAGRIWTFSQSVADVAPEDWGGVSRDLD